MICLSCGSDEFVELETVFEPKIKGKKTEIRAKAFICKNCATPIMDTEQMDAFRKRLDAKYKANMEKHNKIVGE